jgi:hypothetical protein
MEQGREVGLDCCVFEAVGVFLQVCAGAQAIVLCPMNPTRPDGLYAKASNDGGFCQEWSDHVRRLRCGLLVLVGDHAWQQLWLRFP